MTSPYRQPDKMELEINIDGSLFLRFLAVFIPVFVGNRWQWFRKALGGRWSPLYTRLTNYDRNVVMSHWKFAGWIRTKECPESTMTYDGADVYIETSGECNKDLCKCENWS